MTHSLGSLFFLSLSHFLVLQVQNSALRTQPAVTQGLTPSLGQQLPTLAMRPAPSNGTHSASPALQSKAAGLTLGPKGSLPDNAPEHLRKGEGGVGSNGTAGNADSWGNAANRMATPVTTHPLIAPGESPPFLLAEDVMERL